MTVAAGSNPNPEQSKLAASIERAISVMRDIS
jgi:hypothetical protein